jgi:hypothetical protein
MFFRSILQEHNMPSSEIGHDVSQYLKYFICGSVGPKIWPLKLHEILTKIMLSYNVNKSTKGFAQITATYKFNTLPPIFILPLRYR